VATIMLTEYEQMKDRLLYLIATRNEESLNPSPIWPTTPEVFT
jgi:hypothetical protein